MVYYPLSMLMLAGIREILVISTTDTQPIFQRLLGNGEQLGLRFEYVIQESPRGLADAFRVGRDFIGDDSVSLILGDNIFFGHGLPNSLREAAALLGVSDKSIYRWIKHRKLPAFKINEQYRFHRVEVLAWASAQRVNVPANSFFEVGEQETPMPGLAEALKAGGIYYRIGGTDTSIKVGATRYSNDVGVIDSF